MRERQWDVKKRRSQFLAHNSAGARLLWLNTGTGSDATGPPNHPGSAISSVSRRSGRTFKIYADADAIDINSGRWTVP